MTLLTLSTTEVSSKRAPHHRRIYMIQVVSFDQLRRARRRVKGGRLQQTTPCLPARLQSDSLSLLYAEHICNQAHQALRSSNLELPNSHAPLKGHDCVNARRVGSCHIVTNRTLQFSNNIDFVVFWSTIKTRQNQYYQYYPYY